MQLADTSGRCLRRGEGERAGTAARISAANGSLLDVPDSPDGVRQARMQHVCTRIRRKVKLLDVAHGVEPAAAGLVDVPEQTVLPQHGGEVRRLLEVQIRHFLQCLEIRPRESVNAYHPDEGANVLLHAADISLGCW